MRELIRHHGLILLVAILILFTNLGGARLWDQDEARNAGCALEMMQRGDWIVPIFNEQLRDAKPVLLYWLILASYHVFGVNEFAARFGSAVLAVGTVLATYQIGRRLLHPTAALWAAMILATSMMFDVAGRAATPDSTLIFCSTASIMFFVIGTFTAPVTSTNREMTPVRLQPECLFPQRFAVLLPMYGMMGLGVLAKGPVGFVLPTAVIGMYLLVQRLPASHCRPATLSPSFTSAESRWKQAGWLCLFLSALVVSATISGGWGLISLAVLLSAGLTLLVGTGWTRVLRPFGPTHFLSTCWSMRPVLALVAIAAVALPWYVLVGIRTEGDFIRGFFVHEHFGRATTAMENHDGPPIYYVLAILVGFFPWSVLAVPVVIDVVRRMMRGDASRDGLLLLICWVCVYVGLFTLASTKLPSYITPCYPALALLTGYFVYQWTRGLALVPQFWPQVSMSSLVFVGCAMIVGISFFARQYLPGHGWLGAIGLIPIASGLAGFYFLRREQIGFAARVLAASAVLFAVVVFGGMTEQIDRHRFDDQLLREIVADSTTPQVGHFGPLEPSWVFYGRRPIRSLSLDNPPAGAKRDKEWHPAPKVDVLQFLSDSEAPFVITTDQHLRYVSSRLPQDVTILARVPHFLRQDELVLLGKRPTPGTYTADRKRAGQRN